MERDIYRRAKEFLILLAKKSKGSGYLQHYSMCYSDRPDNWGLRNACYSGISGYDIDEVTNCEAFYTVTNQKYQSKALDYDNARPYYKWLIKDSPFAKVFKTKDVQYCLEVGVVCHVDVPHPLFGAAIISQRTPWEYPQQIRLWNILVNGGVLPEVAYILMGSLLLKKDDSIAVGCMGGGHFPIDNNLGKDSIINFLKREPKEANVKTFKANRGYSGCSAMWGNVAPYPSKGSLVEYFDKVFNKKFPNVLSGFGGESGGVATNKEIISIVLEYQGTLLKEFVS